MLIGIRTTMRYGLLACIILSVFGAALSGRNCPDLDKFCTALQEKPFIRLSFRQLTYSDIFESVDTITGELVAGGEGRFRLTTRSMALVSDGILFWNYSVENRQVLVDSVIRVGELNLLTLLYDPQKAYHCRSQKIDSGELLFEMMADDSLSFPDSFKLSVSSNGLTPKRLIYFDNNDSRVEVYIDKFMKVDSLPDSVFEFIAEPGVEVITMP